MRGGCGEGGFGCGGRGGCGILETISECEEGGERRERREIGGTYEVIRGYVFECRVLSMNMLMVE